MIGNFGVTPSGVIVKQVSDITSQLQDGIQGDLGPNFTLVPNTPEGQLMARCAEQCADLWEFGLQAFLNRFPVSAGGNALDQALSIVNIQRIADTASVVNGAILSGTPGTVVPNTLQVSVSGNPSAVFQLQNAVTIGAGGTVAGTFVCLQTGPVDAPINTLTNIVTVVAGLASVNNPVAVQLGAVAESDSSFRQRAKNELSTSASATYNGIRRALQAVPNVASVALFSNDSDTAAVKEVWTVTVVTNTASTQYTITLNGVHYTITSASGSPTAASIATLLAAAITDPSVVVTTSTAAVIITAANAGDVFAVSINDDPAVGNYTNAGMTTALTTSPVLRPHSLMALVSGGADADIANTLLATKGAGINTDGSQSSIINDSQGTAHTIRFARPYPIAIYMGIALTVNTNPALGPVFPSDGVSQVQNAVIAFGAQYIAGQTVVLQAFNNPVFSVPGILSATLTMSASNSPFPPVATSSTLAVSPNQTPVFTASTISVSVS